MLKPTYPVKRICYADDISVWASGAKIPELEVKINDYLEKMSRVLKVKLSADISPKVNSYSLHPRDKASQVPPRHQDSWLSTSTEPQSEDLRGPPGHIPNFQRALHTSGNKSQQQKQRLECLGRHYLGTTEGDDTDDLQGNRKVGRKLRCPSLEY